MIEARNRTRGRAADHGGMFGDPISGFANSPEAQPVIKRVGESICPFSPIDQTAHAVLVAQVAMRAKRHPNNAYAKATA